MQDLDPIGPTPPERVLHFHAWFRGMSWLLVHSNCGILPTAHPPPPGARKTGDENQLSRIMDVCFDMFD